MSVHSKILESIPSSGEEALVDGKWRPISLCFDEIAREYLNVGVIFEHGGKVDVRMLDSFERIKCLYDKTVDIDSLSYYLHDIEDSIVRFNGELPDTLSDTIRLGQPLYASGRDADSVIDSFFYDVVTLGRINSKSRDASFRYRSTQKLRTLMFELIKDGMGLSASRIIQEKKFNLRIKDSGFIEIDIPLMSGKAAGSIVSAWYKSPMVVENNLLQASSDLFLLKSNSDIGKVSLSILVPDIDSGLSSRDYKKLMDLTSRQLDRMDRAGIEIIDAHTVDGLSKKTVSWWEDVAA
ncbi:hypothetical protein [Gallaecimonas xiamenensis]|uniref:hypothetical protein n=1 Tax=Gallaecimonas xiamenensis TaxID=1207039 RepID=UPI000551763E|nr:hypothetical protein [Gallaecimonas xiamenensis]